MITKIEIANLASFKSATSIDPEKINFIFGTNGVGKTTISNFLKTETPSESCKVNWLNDCKLKPFVFNRDFIDENFASHMQGVFTLGSEENEVQEKLKEKISEKQSIEVELSDLNKKLENKEDDLSKIKSEFKEVCFDQQRKHKPMFEKAFEGLGTKDKFLQETLNQKQQNKRNLNDITVLEDKAKVIFSETPQKIDLITTPNHSKIKKILINPIWEKVIVGAQYVGIASLINKLENSDWVNQGQAYLEQSDDKCPFCQQGLPDEFTSNLGKYFNDQFINDKTLIDELIKEWISACKSLLPPLENLTDEQKNYDSYNLVSLVREYRFSLEKNFNFFRNKKSNPSHKIKIENVDDTAEKINKSISQFNEKITEHNRQVDNQKFEEKNLKEDVWKFILNELKTPLSQYESKEKELTEDISKLKTEIQSKNADLEKTSDKVSELGQKTADIRPTAIKINQTLERLGFTSFKLEIDSNDTSKYRIVRDGESDEDVYKTLSEGEKNFISFLYFYHLTDGSISSEDINTDRVIIIDDPVSSLDETTMFVVGSLIYEIIERVTKDSNVKQIFILTHNVYFYRQVSFRTKSDDRYFIIRKDLEGSIIESYSKNPIKSTYDLLWEEVKADPPSKTALPNALRRILEFYFNLVGDIDLKDLPKKFEPKEKQIFHSLISWLHVNSHAELEDFHFPNEDLSLQLKVFKQIFEKSGHITHYNMMMEKKN